MSVATSLRCLRCGALYPLTDYARVCAACDRDGPSGMEVVYEASMLAPRPFTPQGRGLWRYGDLLPVGENEAVSLGEGGTPLLALPRVGALIGLDQLFAKDETREPTGSFKDRLACIGVSAARKMGARVIVSSSSGNAGAAAAAYAARAGMACVVFTFAEASPTLVAQMRAFGALVAFADREHRLPLLREGMRRHGWFPTSPFTDPVTGSNPIAIEGYKTLAYEIAEALDWEPPDWCVLPVCYGDALAAIRRGFADMVALGWTRRVPRLVAAEVSGSLSSAMASGADAPPEIRRNAPSLATSIGAARGSFQSLDALRRSNGIAVRVNDSAILEWRATLAQREGLWLEPSAAAAFAAVAELTRDGRIARGDRVVVLATAGGLKDPNVDVGGASPIPVVPNDFDAALAIIRNVYGSTSVGAS